MATTAVGERVVVLDTETTGLNPKKDEVLSLAIVDGDGNELFHHLIKPLHRRRWSDASEVNGIEWNDVKDEMELEYYADEIRGILNGADVVVGYNLVFDLEMLSASGLSELSLPSGIKTFDVMLEYSRIHGVYSERKGENLWAKLEKCAKHYGYQFQPHNALEDAKATAYCYRALLADTKYVEHNGHIKEHKQNQKNIGLAVLALGVIVLFLNVTTGIILMIIGSLVLGTSR
jgi:DNA polymerase III epsilon subunit-like protein